MRRRAIASFIAACALSACAHEAPPDPSSFAGMRWGTNPDAGEPTLFYGVPDSDELWIMMSCAPRSGVVSVTELGVEGRNVRLRAGGRSLDVRASALGDIEGLVAEVDAVHPVMQAFARTGLISYGSEKSVAALPPAEPALVGGFLAACR